MTKLTNKVALTTALSALDLADIQLHSDFTNEEIADKLNEMLKALEKKASGERKPTAAQQANAIIKDEIVKALEGRHLSAREVADALNLDSSNKAAALLTQLVKAGKVRKEEGEKGKAVYIAV